MSWCGNPYGAMVFTAVADGVVAGLFAVRTFLASGAEMVCIVELVAAVNNIVAVGVLNQWQFKPTDFILGLRLLSWILSRVLSRILSWIFPGFIFGLFGVWIVIVIRQFYTVAGRRNNKKRDKQCY